MDKYQTKPRAKPSNKEVVELLMTQPQNRKEIVSVNGKDVQKEFVIYECPS